MHPALSVVFFTAVSGSGYGLLFLLGLLLCLAPERIDATRALWMLAVGTLLATTGLLASLAHLGQPQRAWRAISQWRSSWLSREGVAALLGYLPIAAIALALVTDAAPLLLQVGGVLLALLALLTVYCTACIYTSLVPVPAWRHRLVVPGYLGFALLGGVLWLAALQALLGQAIAPLAGLAATVLAMLLGLLKWRYWRDIDAAPLPVTLASATGVAGASGMRALEAPHTEANYLLREMGFVLARRHGSRLRRLSLLLLAASALATLAAALLAPLAPAAALMALAALITGQTAILLERWLFFAQARHLVTLYYGATGAADRVMSSDFTAT
jgi:sulfite dehydrogenase (quinone) subunit SoeC